MVAIRDKFPKAKTHFLIMPRPAILGFATLGVHSIAALERMRDRGRLLATAYVARNFQHSATRLTQSHCYDRAGVACRIGFHAIPSMAYVGVDAT
jgi:hypothetical protein